MPMAGGYAPHPAATHLPLRPDARQALAEHGEVGISGHDIAKLIGKVFLQKSAVNLLVRNLEE